MLFTWDTTNLCIVFPSWRVTGTFSLIWSLVAVVALTAGYEAIREVSRRYEERLAENVQNATSKSAPKGSPGGTGVRACNALLTRRSKADVERNSLLTAGNSVATEEKKGKTIKAALYGVQVFYSFFIM
jgi:copper transporter 1